MVRKILEAGDKRLRQKSKPVAKIDKKIKAVIRDLKDTLKNQKDPEGVGLAAPQIGKNVRIFLMKSSSKAPAKVVINPEIISVSKQKMPQKGKIMEGCLSLPKLYGPLKRPQKLTLKYLTEKGTEKTEVFEDFPAQVVQHEVDHLDGILFVDKLLKQKGPLYEIKGDEWLEVELI